MIMGRNLEKKGKKDTIRIPTHGEITKKGRPMMEGVNFPLVQIGQNQNDANTLDMEVSIVTNDNDEMSFAVGAQLLNPDAMMIAPEGGGTVNEEECVRGARITGGYNKVVDVMMEKHEGKLTVPPNESIIVLDSFDVSEHSKNHNELKNIISFSSFLYAPSWINSRKMCAGSSSNILTWQQTNGKESVPHVLSFVKEHFESKKLFMDSNDLSKYSMYDVHDGKMLYLLTQHSAWNRRFQPFLLCKCKRGEGVINNMNPKFQCKMMNNRAQTHYYNKSKREWEKKTYKDPGYSVKEHMDWID